MPEQSGEGGGGSTHVERWLARCQELSSAPSTGPHAPPGRHGVGELWKSALAGDVARTSPTHGTQRANSASRHEAGHLQLTNGAVPRDLPSGPDPFGALAIERKGQRPFARSGLSAEVDNRGGSSESSPRTGVGRGSTLPAASEHGRESLYLAAATWRHGSPRDEAGGTRERIAAMRQPRQHPGDGGMEVAGP